MIGVTTRDDVRTFFLCPNISSQHKQKIDETDLYCLKHDPMDITEQRMCIGLYKSPQ